MSMLVRPIGTAYITYLLWCVWCLNVYRPAHGQSLTAGDRQKTDNAAGGGPGRSRMITRMRQAALRTLLVVSERPHPWAFLRDRLDPDLVTVSWARPADAGRTGAPWTLAGAGAQTGALAAFRDRLL